MVLGCWDAEPIHMKFEPSKEGTPQVLFAIVTVWVHCQPTGDPELKSSPKTSELPFATTDKVAVWLHGKGFGEYEPVRLHWEFKLKKTVKKTANIKWFFI